MSVLQGQWIINPIQLSDQLTLHGYHSLLHKSSTTDHIRNMAVAYDGSTERNETRSGSIVNSAVTAHAQSSRPTEFGTKTAVLVERNAVQHIQAALRLQESRRECVGPTFDGTPHTLRWMKCQVLSCAE